MDAWNRTVAFLKSTASARNLVFSFMVSLIGVPLEPDENASKFTKGAGQAGASCQ